MQKKQMVAVSASLVLVAALFWLPYLVPVAPSVSASYVFGYNNRVAVLLVAAAAIVLFLFGPEAVPAIDEGRPLSGRTMKKALAGTFVVSTALYLWTRKLDGFGESVYMIDRVRLLLEGRVPYREFEFAYGAMYLYGPAMVARLLHLGAGDAYGLFFVAVTLIGLSMLYVSLQWMEGAPAAKRAVFLFFWAFSLMATANMGLNYSLLRYVLPYFCALLLYRGLRSANGDRRHTWLLLLPLPMYLLLQVNSPEFAIAFGLGSTAYLLYFGWLVTTAHWLVFAATLAGMVGSTVIAARLGALLTMNAFRFGGYNFPVMPAPHLLVFFLAIGISACCAGSLVRSKRRSEIPLLLAIGMCALPAALGRCDPVHVLYNGLPWFVTAALLTHGWGRRWRLYQTALWLVFIVISGLWEAKAVATALGKSALPSILAMERSEQPTRLDGWILGRMEAQLGAELAHKKFAEYRVAARRRGVLDLDAMFDQSRGTIYEAPFGFSVTHFGLYHVWNVDEGYFFEGADVIRPEQVERKMGELAAHPERPVLLLEAPGEQCGVSNEKVRAEIAALFLYPYRARVVHDSDVAVPLCRFIQTHYFMAEAATAEHFGYALWASNH